MKEILLECLVCLAVASLLMVLHELLKAGAYVVIRKHQKSYKKPVVSALHCWKYVDGIGLIFSVCCGVPVSRPHMFRIHDRQTNRILGIVGFMALFSVFVLSILVLRYYYGGLAGLSELQTGLFGRIAALFWQYLAMLSFGMFVANLFPVSTFDMGLLIAGYSSRHYLQIIKSDALIKLLFLLTLFLDLIHYGYVRLVSLLL